MCEGYARYPVFLNRTIEGPQRRHGLEEAKTPFAQVGQGPVETPTMQSNVDFQRGLVEARRANDNRMLVQSDPSSIFDQQIVATFWAKYLPSDPSARGRQPCLWLEQVLALPSPSEPLQLSLKALAMTRLGFVNRDEALVLQGNQYYGRALQAVQKSLWNERSMRDDEIFAAGYVLSVYEVSYL